MAEKMYCAVKALIEECGRFLFIEYGPPLLDGVLDLPGGRVEKGEDPLDALVREVKEETSFDVLVGKPVGVYWLIRENDGDQVNAMLFECKAKTISAPANTSPDPIKAFHWLTLDEALGKNFGKKTTLKKLLSSYSSLR